MPSIHFLNIIDHVRLSARTFLDGNGPNFSLTLSLEGNSQLEYGCTYMGILDLTLSSHVLKCTLENFFFSRQPVRFIRLENTERSLTFSFQTSSHKEICLVFLYDVWPSIRSSVSQVLFEVFSALGHFRAIFGPF